MYTRHFVFFVAGLLSITVAGSVAGCGGGTDIYRDNRLQATAIPTATPSPVPIPSLSVAWFAGVWSGPITLNTGENGVTEITIAEDGTISGLAISLDEDFGFQEQGSASGTIDANGKTLITFTYENARYSGNGVLSLDSTQNQLFGTLTQTVNGVVRGSVRAELERGPLPRT